jgi:hypothetical protein
MVPGAARGKISHHRYHGNKILTRMENRLVWTRVSEFHSGCRAYSVQALRNVPWDVLTSNRHSDTQIVIEFVERKYRVSEVPVPTYYGGEICRVKGIPYAADCIAETLLYALKHRWRRAARVPRPVGSQRRSLQWHTSGGSTAGLHVQTAGGANG